MSLKLFTTDDLTTEDRAMFTHWAKYNSKIIQFENYANNQLFVDIFGHLEGSRLWPSFVNRCDRKYTKLLTYLNTDQQTVLNVNLLKYEHLAKGVL
jgi:hypothetical protein